MSKTYFYILLGFSFSIGCYLFIQPLQTISQNIIAYLLFFVPIILTLWKLLGWNYNTFLNIGQITLSIYVLHVIILYRGFFGFKIGAYLKNSLSPFFAISCTILFVFFFLTYAKFEPLLIYKVKRLRIRYKIVKKKIQYRSSTV